ncbi:MAG TPA: ATP-binding protein [Solirubrobacteraceae bacterium]|nr:ATP-binding protein [Solirubrobacteraceae bacterium]
MGGTTSRRARRPLGLRPRLAGGVALILLIVLGATFAAIYRGVGHDLRIQVDRDLRGDLDAFAAHVLPATSGGQVAARAQRFLAARPFTASAHVLYAVVPGRPVVTNEPELLGTARADDGEPLERQDEENAAARRVLAAPPGVRTVELPDAGEIRLLVRAVTRDGLPVAKIAAGESLEPLHRAQRGVANAALVAIPVALVVGTLLSALLADRVTRRLRRMAGVAARVDAGELSPRMGVADTAGEVRVLAESFDHMLDRLEDAFARQAAFVADASHELRTPLTVVRGQLEVLAMQERPDAQEVRRVERMVRVEVERMSRMVDDLLILAAAGEPRFLRPAAVRLPAFLRELVHAIEPTADRAFELEVVPDLTVRADPDRLAQALRNLLRNAIAHTEPGGRIGVGAVASGGRVRILVDDDGPGIPAQERERVWGRFHRSAGGRARDAGGAGLGLAIVRAIAEAHGGTAFADASPLGGARVGIELPLAPARDG